MKAPLQARSPRTSLLAAVLLLTAEALPAQESVRKEVRIPDIPGFVTLKCDFHMHTVFSDGNVWPPVRVEEAWREGLDAISITDHIEYQPHEDEIPTSHNRPYELARGRAAQLGLLFVRGAEITRKMPPGHFNAIFTTDNSELDTEKWRDALAAAKEQGAFVFWNHPSFPHPEGISEWFAEHTESTEKQWMRGIEVVNGRTYYPESHRWCLEKKLTMIASSDVHDPVGYVYDFAAGEHRPMTLVFAREKSESALREALLERRTVVYREEQWIGEAKYLKPLFEASLRIVNPQIVVRQKSQVLVQIQNSSELDFHLTLRGKVEGLSTPAEVTLPAERTALLSVRGTSDTLSGSRKVALPYVVENLLVAPDEGLKVGLSLEARFVPKAQAK